jgi:16S rRNA (cytidine1402-2'-O)-methyltransferase
MSEAGVPAVADPGAQLVRLAHQNHIIVRPMVGPSSLLLALMASGLNGQQFAFDGYLPIELHARHQRIKALEQRSRQENQTQIVIETPYRNLSLLESLCKTCDPHTELCVATDLTLSSESIQTRSIGEWRTLLTRHASPNLNKRPTVFLFLACK